MLTSELACPLTHGVGCIEGTQISAVGKQFLLLSHANLLRCLVFRELAVSFIV